MLMETTKGVARDSADDSLFLRMKLRNDRPTNSASNYDPVGNYVLTTGSKNVIRSRRTFVGRRLRQMRLEQWRPWRQSPGKHRGRSPRSDELSLIHNRLLSPAGAGASGGVTRGRIGLRENRASIARLNAGRSPGCRLVIQLPSSTTPWSTQ